MRLYRRPPITEHAKVPELVITPIDGLAVAKRGRQIVAASLSAVNLAETGYSDVTYVPKDNVDPSLVVPSEGDSRCPWKGDACYFEVAGTTKAAWTYFEANERVAEISGRIAFDARYIDVDIITLPDLPEEAQALLDFWFVETSAKMHFKQDDAFDSTCRDRFGDLYEKAQKGELTHWADHPESGLALLILLDQFSRNLFRNRAEAFAQDEAAQAITAEFVEKGFDLALPTDRRAFAYMPLMHAENMVLQNRSVELFSRRLPGSTNIPYAIGHRETYHQHGRFPGRDAARGAGQS